jgi:hypothetical protein
LQTNGGEAETQKSQPGEQDMTKRTALEGWGGLTVAALLCIAPAFAAEPDVVRNSVFTQELADQCADTAHFNCRTLVAPEGTYTKTGIIDVAPPAPIAPEPPRQDKFNCTGCLRR